MTEPVAAEVGRDFIRDIVQADLDQGKYREIVTRFPPEPNGYLHIGHAKSIALNFGIAQEFPGRCHLRFDDTNPVKEEQEYIDSIQADVRWLGFDWGKNLFFASDYFDRLYEWAEQLIRDGLAYVDDQTQEEIRLSRGTLTEPGKNSPFRDRSVDENLGLFRRMKAGEFPNGTRVLRAKIDMAAGNINLRDPVLYRILHAHHPRTGTKWHIYPSYDYAHGQSDAIEGITHSICTLEFEDHRPLYDWFIEKLPVPSQPHQYEFARLNLTYTLLSKRVLTQLVRDGHVAGWDDPRMPTMAGMRRRGVPPAALREFVKRIGVAKANSVVDVGMLEFCIREELNRTSQRRMGVLRPLKVVIENYPEGQTEELEAINHPDDPSAGTRKITFGRELYIEQDDFMENPPKKFFRLSPGNEVRLRYAYFVKCTGVIKNDKGEVVELRCTYDPATKGGKRARRPQGQGDDALAAGGGVGARGDPHLQPAVRQSEPGRPKLRGRSQSELAGDPQRRSDRGIGRSEQFDRADAVRAAGLFRPRQGLDAGQAGVLPHHRPARHLREGSRKRVMRI
ncbi:glutaminyl-tRNA synthetase [Bradyrhizobium ottawaense]